MQPSPPDKPAVDAAVTRFKQSLASHRLTILAFYRGHWCPVCRAWVTRFLDVEPSLAAWLREHDAQLLFVCSQRDDAVQRTAKAWHVGNVGGAEQSVTFVSDPENALAVYLRERGLCEVAVTGLGRRDGYANHRYRYDNGMAQPAVLVMRGGGGSAAATEPGEAAAAARVVYRWAIRPGVMNMGGAVDRPDPVTIMAAVSAAESEAKSGREAEVARAKSGKSWLYQRRMVTRWLGLSDAKKRSEMA